MTIAFQHRQSAHCETGVLANLLTHHGLPVSEAMVFGMGSGLFFAYLPFIRLNHLPLTAFRAATGAILKKVTRRLGIRLEWAKFRNPAKAEAALDAKLAEGLPVGCRTGAYWLPYFPPRYRFHFNMHNLVVFGREDDDYLVSDPVMPDVVRCPAPDLLKARFAKGPMPPKGRLYTVQSLPESPDLAGAALQGITDVCRSMLGAPGPFLGVRGIRHLSRVVPRWPEKLGPRQSILYLGQVVRMQEEIGTGGGGFRYIHAAFLQEAAGLLGIPELRGLSERMTEIGDRWRTFALMASRICKARASEGETWPALGEILADCAERERALFTDLRDAVRQAGQRSHGKRMDEMAETK